MASLSVEIVTPERCVLSARADEAIIPGFHGLFGVRSGHTPFLSVMEPGTLTLRDGAGTQYFFVAGGFVKVGDDKVMVLADAAEPVSGIDVAAAKKRLEDAQAKLVGLNAGEIQFAVESATVKRETARLASAGRR